LGVDRVIIICNNKIYNKGIYNAAAAAVVTCW